jgi:type IV secretion system protein VirD4
MFKIDAEACAVGAIGGLALLLLLRKRDSDRTTWFIVARALLLAGSVAVVLVGIAALVFVLAAVAPILLVGLLFLGMRARKRKVEVSSVHGTARWAETSELAGWAMFQDGGLPVGLAPKATLRQALGYLNSAPLWASEAACRMALSALRGKRLPLNIHHGTHAVCFAPAGKGKSTGLVIPFLATCSDSMVVLDVKGELFRETGAYRQRVLGHRIVAIDPYCCVTDQPDTLNPLDLVRHSRFPDDDVRAIAEALVVWQSSEERDPHFNDAAEMHVGAITALVLSAFQDGDLQSMAAILASPEALARARVEMRQSQAFGGMLARMGDQLSHFVDKELASTLTTTARHLRFLSTEAIVRSTTTSSFDPRELATGNMTIYLVLPPVCSVD